MAQSRRVMVFDLLRIRDGIPSNKDAKMTNVLAEENGDANNYDLAVMKRPGYKILATSTATSTGSHIGGAIQIFIGTNTTTAIFTFILATGTNTTVEINKTAIP